MNWKNLLSKERIKKSETTDSRNEFESDFGRIIYSPALRRMHDKTQVFPLTTDDNIHSRLTHSNEVMSIGYTFGIKLSESEAFQNLTGKSQVELLREVPVLLKNVCLIHDIGNSPFGHFGETLVSEYFKDLKNDNFNKLNEREKKDFLEYDGNAQGLRVLTKLQYIDNPFGLNLTYATLGAYLKYPNFGELNEKKKERIKKEKGRRISDANIESNKHGVFKSEEKYFEKIAENCGLIVNGRVVRHPLCYLMEAADSIAYLCMDMEDGVNKKLYGIDYIKNRFFDNGAKVSKEIVKICDDELFNPTSKIVKIRIKLIQYFVDLAFANFEQNIDKIQEGEYNTELIEQDEDKVFKILKGISGKIFSSREVCHLETTGHSVFHGLFDYYIKFIFHENKKFVSKAKNLISRSIIDCAIEENLIELSEKRISEKKKKLKEEIEAFCNDEDELFILQKELEIINVQEEKFENIKNEYNQLFDLQYIKALDKSESARILKLKEDIFNNEYFAPKFEDLSEYYKFRVILDFISGMTDQFALNHFQKISGQKIK